MDLDDASLLLTSEALTLLDSLPPFDGRDEMVRWVSRLRDRGISPELTRVVLRQRRLRAEAEPKFGEFAARMLFTEDGLQQATRLRVAAHHAARFRALGNVHVGDLGCGIGSDTLALAGLGVDVTAIDRDEPTAALAAYNLAPFDNAHVEVGDVETLDASRFDAVWFDPARRSSGRRLADPGEWSPSLDRVFAIAANIPSGVKLSPAIPHDLIPDGVEAQWVDDHGETVECVVWTGALARPDIARAALVIGDEIAELTGPEPDSEVPVGPIQRYLYDPRGAVIRAQLLGTLARQLDATIIAPAIAYLTSDSLTATPFAQAFRILDILQLDIRTIARRCHDEGIGVLEIKKRGVDIDPATFRTKLKLMGNRSAVLVLTRAGSHRVAILAERA